MAVVVVVVVVCCCCCCCGGGGGGGGADLVYDVCVSPYALTMHAPNSVGRTPGSQDSRRPRHPFPALMAGETPGRVPVYTALKTHPITP